MHFVLGRGLKMAFKHSKKWYVKFHRHMWNDIAEEIKNSKSVLRISVLKMDWCISHNIYPLGACFACEYCGNRDCEVGCPFNWAPGEEFTRCGNGLYKKCKMANTWQEQYELAREIANLPVREYIR